MAQSIIQIGNSQGVAIPKDIREKAGLKKGTKVEVDLTHDNRVVISKTGSKNTVGTITPEFIEILERVNKRYGPALKKLSKL